MTDPALWGGNNKDDRYLEMALRPYPVMRAMADKRVSDQSMPGDSVVFNIYADLPVTTSTLTETTDPDTVGIPSTSTVTVTLVEYGKATLTTRKLRTFVFSDVDPAVADIVAYDMVNTLDGVVRTALIGGTNVTRENAGTMLFNTGTVGAVEADDTLKSRAIRASVTKLRGRNAPPRNGADYVSIIHPDCSYDLRSEAGSSATWRPPHEQSAATPIWAGVVGTYEGAVFIESPRVYSTTDGSGSATVYRNVMMGRQALAEVVAQEPGIVLGPITDRLMRLRPVGWYGILGWSRYREDCLQRIEVSSSIA